jgi:hypothetical protein
VLRTVGALYQDRYFRQNALILISEKNCVLQFFSVGCGENVIRLASRNASYFGVTSCHAFYFQIKSRAIFIWKWNAAKLHANEFERKTRKFLKNRRSLIFQKLAGRSAASTLPMHFLLKANWYEYIRNYRSSVW